MGVSQVGQVVILAFPFSDFSDYKLRPALIVATAEYASYIVCQITSQPKTSRSAIKLINGDLIEGNLRATSYIRPDKLVTIDARLIQGQLGTLKLAQLKTVMAKLRQQFTLPSEH